MSPEVAAVLTLTVTFALAVLVDRGVPNTLESLAFVMESVAAWTVRALRRSASALRRRHQVIEREHQERMAGIPRLESLKPTVSSRSSSAAA